MTDNPRIEEILDRERMLNKRFPISPRKGEGNRYNLNKPTIEATGNREADRNRRRRERKGK